MASMSMPSEGQWGQPTWPWASPTSHPGPAGHPHLTAPDADGALLYRALGGGPGDPMGPAGFAAALRAVSPSAFRRAFADPTTTTGSPGPSSAPHARPCWWRGNENPGPSAPRTPRLPP